MSSRVPSLVVVLLAAPCLADAPPRPLPVSAHNCYPTDSTSRARLVEALALGLDNIEIDLGWDAAKQRLIVGHDASPRPGIAYPDLEDYLVPALEEHWSHSRADRAPTVLTLDWKTDEPAAVARFREFLETHADWFSSAPKAAESPLTVRRLTVCFTGSDTAKDHYDALIPPGGTYRAFRDTVFGAGSAYREDVKAYAPDPATAYHRFFTFAWSHVERGGAPGAGSWTADEAARLAALIDLVHRQGYRARLYTLNGHTGPFLLSPYRLADDTSAQLRWRFATAAGADWIATDEYADAARVLNTPPRIVILGDSTVCDYPADSNVRGWGQFLGTGFRDGVTVRNLAVSGRSTTTFIAEGRLRKALAERADYALIQFGHNDSHGPDRPESTVADADFRDNLRTYIDAFRTAGTQPILVTPMHRRTFRDGRPTQELRPYAAAMESLGRELAVPVVDLHASSGALFERLGDDASADLSCAPNDRTHFSEKGARAMAGLVLDGLKEINGGLVRWIR
jgi:lysophospholipase L1-like esterase